MIPYGLRDGRGGPETRVSNLKVSSRLATSMCYLALSLVSLAKVDFSPGLVLNKSSRGTYLS